jgi:tape measure domain-containing protein
MAGTINTANLSASFDVTKLKEGMNATRAEINKLGSILRQTQPATSKFNQEMDLLKNAFRSGAISFGQLKNAIDTLREKYGVLTPAMQAVIDKEKQQEQQEQKNILRLQQFEKSLERLRRQTASGDPLIGFGKSAQASETSFSGLSSVLGKFATAASVATASYKAFRTVQEGFQLAVDQEQIVAQLEVLTGSSETAKRLTDDFVKLDRQSALTAINFQEAAKLLLGYGMSANQVTPTLDNLSEISMGNAQRFQSLALAFGQVQAQGRLMGQEVLQMVNAGFNPLQEISRTTGIDMLVLKKRMEDGAISAEMVAEAFRTATSEGGRFNDMNEKMATTTSVKMSKLANEWQMFKRSLGEEVRPGINNALDAINGTIQSARSFGPWFDEFWATATGNADEFHAARQRALETEKELQGYLEKEAKQIEEGKRLAKERAEIDAALAKDQEERWQAEEKRIAARKDAFAKTGQSEFEKMQRATMGDAEFERRQITNPNFAMTEAERLQAAETLDNMAETRRQLAMTQLRQEIEASKKKVDDEARIAEMRKLGVLANDEDRRKAVDIQNQFLEQQKAEQQRLAERIVELKRQGGGDLFIDRARRESEARLQEMKQLAQSALSQLEVESKVAADQAKQAEENEKKESLARSIEQMQSKRIGEADTNIAPAIRAGTVEAYKMMNKQNEDARHRQEHLRKLDEMKEEFRKFNEKNTVVLSKRR